MPRQHELTGRLPRDRLLFATGITVWCAMAMSITSPLLAPILLVGCAVVSGIWIYLDGGTSVSIEKKSALPALLLLIWFAASITWTPERGTAIWAVATMTVFVAAVLAAIALGDALIDDVRQRIAIAFVLGIGFMLWMSLEEEASGLFLRRLTSSFAPMTRAHSINERLASGWITGMHGYMSNKNIAMGLLMTWPFLLLSLPLAKRPWQKALRLATLTTFIVAIWMSDHETSKLAIAASAIVFALALRWQPVAFALVAAGWIIASLLVVPLTLAAYKAGAHTVETVQYSGRHRMVIWGFTSERILARPIFGYGLGSTKLQDETAPPAKIKTAGQDITVAKDAHAHNVFLQAYHETGLIGGLLLSLIGLPMLGWLKTRSQLTAPYLLAAFTSAVVMASLSWSLVATWYAAAFGLVIVWCRFGDRFVAPPHLGMSTVARPA